MRCGGRVADGLLGDKSELKNESWENSSGGHRTGGSVNESKRKHVS